MFTAYDIILSLLVVTKEELFLVSFFLFFGIECSSTDGFQIFITFIKYFVHSSFGNIFFNKLCFHQIIYSSMFYTISMGFFHTKRGPFLL